MIGQLQGPDYVLGWGPLKYYSFYCSTSSSKLVTDLSPGSMQIKLFYNLKLNLVFRTK